MRSISILRGLALPALLVAAVFACKKPDLSEPGWDGDAPLLSRVTLEDSLPARTIALMKAKQIDGFRLKYMRYQRDVRYFEYEADAMDVIRALSLTPFDPYASVSDTLCRQLTREESAAQFASIAEDEKSHAANFFSVDPDRYTVFECIKAPARHILLVEKGSRRIFHRIES